MQQNTSVPKWILWLVVLAHIMIAQQNFILWQDNWINQESFYEFQMSCWDLYEVIKKLEDSPTTQEKQKHKYLGMLFCYGREGKRIVLYFKL